VNVIPLGKNEDAEGGGETERATGELREKLGWSGADTKPVFFGEGQAEMQ